MIRNEAARASVTTVTLRDCLADPLLDVMNFLNEVMLRFPNAISFAAGRPPQDLFDVRRTVEGLGHYLSARHGAMSEREWNALGGYNRTNGTINELVAAHLAQDEGIHVPADAIMITVGAQEAMAVVLLGLFEPGRDVLLTSDPTYIGITALARLFGIRLIPVPSDDEGLDPDAVARVLQRQGGGDRIRAVYDIPDFNNPLGSCLSMERRRALLDCCHRHGALVIEDNPYGMFVYEGDRLPTLKALDGGGMVLYIGTFSKTLFPALRLGYLVADQHVPGTSRTLASELSRVKSLLTVNSSTVLQAMVAGVLTATGGTLEPFVASKRRRLRQARDLLIECLRESFAPSSGVHWTRPRGGYFLSLTLPFEFSAEDCRRCAEDYGVIVCPMQFFALAADPRHRVRLSFSYLDDAAIAEGVRRLARYVAARSRDAADRAD